MKRRREFSSSLEMYWKKYSPLRGNSIVRNRNTGRIRAVLIAIRSTTFPRRIIRIGDQEGPQKKFKKSFNVRDTSVSAFMALRDRCSSISS